MRWIALCSEETMTVRTELDLGAFRMNLRGGVAFITQFATPFFTFT